MSEPNFNPRAEFGNPLTAEQLSENPGLQFVLQNILQQNSPAIETCRLNWMETRTQAVSQYHCVRCDEIFQFASDKDGTERPPVCCPMCGRKAK